jgi:LacI family transcriptional regulator, galactose operon repressor
MKKMGMSEIAKLANVSIGTVDRALHGRGRISKDTRERIIKIAQRVGYKPNLAARALSLGGARVRIGVCIPREIHYYFDQLRDGILGEAQHYEDLGVQVIYRPTERLGLREVAAVSEFLNDDLRVLIITPGDPQGLIPTIDEAERRNIRVICVDTDAPASRRSSVVCLDAELSGRLAADLMAKFAGPGSTVAVITGMVQVESHRKSTQSFYEAYPQFCLGGKVIEVVEAHEDEDEAFQKCFDLLARFKSLAGLYVTTVNCLPVCRAVVARGLSGRIRLITTDLFKEMVPYFKKGTVFASIYGQPYLQGAIAMRFAVDHIVRGRALPASHYLSPQIVMRSTYHMFREMLPPPKDNTGRDTKDFGQVVSAIEAGITLEQP